MQPEPKMASAVIPQLPPPPRAASHGVQIFSPQRNRHNELARRLILTGSPRVVDVWRAFQVGEPLLRQRPGASAETTVAICLINKEPGMPPHKPGHGAQD